LLGFVAGNLRWIKTAKGLAIGLALGQDRRSAQPGLRAFQNQKLEEHTVIVLGNAPLGIVVRDHRRSRPEATSLVRHGSRQYTAPIAAKKHAPILFTADQR